MRSQVEREVTYQEASAPLLTLETSVQYLKGVGPKRSLLFRRLGIMTLRDLLYHFPRRHEDRRAFKPIALLVPGEKVTIRAKVISSSVFRW